MTERKPNGYWEDLGNVLAEAEAEMKRHGHMDRFPTHDQFREWGRADISSAVSSYHGGFLAIREMLGEVPEGTKRKSPGYWQDWDNVVAEANAVVAEKGYLPSHLELASNGQSSLAGAIKSHGGMRKLRDTLGVQQTRTNDNHWEVWDNVEQHMREIIADNNGKFPTQKKLANMGEHAIIMGIAKYHGGLWEVATKMGCEPPQGKRSGWKSWRTTRRHLEAVIEDLGHYPSYEELQKEKGGLLHGLERYHRGYNAARKRMGFETSRKQLGYWCDRKNVLQEAQKFLDEHGFDELPSPDVLSENGASDLRNGIVKCGGFPDIRVALGGTNKKLPLGYWKDLDNVTRKAHEIIEELGVDKLPGQKRLIALGHGSMVGAISKYHGGFTTFRQHLGETNIRGRMGQWQDLDFVIQRMIDVMVENGLDRVPGYNELARLEEPTMGGAISKYHGGMDKFRIIMGETDPKDQLERLLEEYVA